MNRSTFLSVETSRRGTLMPSDMKRTSMIGALPSDANTSDYVGLVRPRGAHILHSGTVNMDIIIRPGLISYHCEILVAPPDGKPFFFLFSSSRAAEAGDESRACFDLSICEWKFAKNPRQDYPFCM
jgi:hypothetical protein